MKKSTALPRLPRTLLATLLGAGLAVTAQSALAQAHDPMHGSVATPVPLSSPAGHATCQPDGQCAEHAPEQARPADHEHAHDHPQAAPNGGQADAHAGHHDHAASASPDADPHAGHGAMSPAPTSVSVPAEHAGHAATPADTPAHDHGSGNTNAAPAPATGPAATSADPHAGHGDMQSGSAPADARDPDAYAGGLSFGPHGAPMHPMTSAALVMDKLEAVHTRHGGDGAAYDLYAFWGGDTDRVWLKAEGEIAGGRIEHSRTELLWGHALAPYWDGLLGVRHDDGQNMPGRDWIGFGVQGLAPWWFEVEAMAYLGENGRSALRLGAEYDLLITQRLILQPRVEANFYGKADPARETGSGLSDLSAGLRLRYEISRQFAPYLGVEWAGKYGGSADHAREAGEPTRETRYVAGVRFWF